MVQDAERAPADAVRFSSNQHGCLWGRCDYIVAIDNLATRPFVREDGSQYHVTEFGVPILSPRRNLATYRMFSQPASSSGVSAAWCAWVCGCSPILLAGMDCYTVGTYWHFKKARSTGNGAKLVNHFNRWRSLVKVAPGIQLRVMSGPLAEIFPPWDAEQPTAPSTPREVLDKAARGCSAKVLKDWVIPPQKYRVGEIIELTQTEYNSGLQQKKIAKI